MFSAPSRASAADVFAICSNENSASCMRAPPLAEKQISGMLLSAACRAARAKRSPTTEPMEPPMNANSKAQATTGRPNNVPVTLTSASFSPVFFCACQQPIAIAFAVTELQRILRLQVCRQLLLRLGIEEDIEALPRADAHVVITLRDKPAHCAPAHFDTAAHRRSGT